MGASRKTGKNGACEALGAGGASAIPRQLLQRAARAPERDLKQPLYGVGAVSDLLGAKFERPSGTRYLRPAGLRPPRTSETETKKITRFFRSRNFPTRKLKTPPREGLPSRDASKWLLERRRVASS
jgi:hypothetical protein